MRHTAAQRQKFQLDLFRPHQPEPDWQTLPAPARQQAVGLLAQLLREHQQRLFRAPAKGEEVGDE